MSYIEELINKINDTHNNLGQLIAVCQIIVKARKMMLIVSPSGCGKSTAISLVAKQTPDSMLPDRLSIAGLCVMADKLTSFRSGIFVDDIATTQTPYARKTTITTLAALVYTHRIQSIMQGIEYTIEDFYGSALIGIQPILLRDLMLLEEWDASIQDKALRYYHLFRPLVPALSLPNVKLNKGIDIDNIGDFEPDYKNKYWRKLVNLADSQWSRARAKEHLKDMLKAVAALEERRNVIDSDYILLSRLLKPMAIENIVVLKEQLEGERYLDNNLLALLAEYYTYGDTYSLAQIALDYKLSLQQCYKIMASQNGYWKQVSKKPTLYSPSTKLKQMLNAFDLEVLNYDNKTD